MKAVLCKEYGPPETLVVEDIEPPVAGEGQVVMDVHAAAVNFPDVLVIENKYQFKPPLPFSPGGEVAGVVTSVGDGVKGFAPGDRIMGLCGMGGFREQLALPAAVCVTMPDALDFHKGAAINLTYGTSYHGLKDRANLQPGETLFVMGASGGVGLAAVELGKAMGAKVIAAASTEEKLAVCREHGADETLLYEPGGLTPEQQKEFSTTLKEMTGGKGIDVIYDPIGGDYAEPALRSMAWKGRYLVVGFVAGPIPKIPLNLTLLKGCSIMGVFWGQFTALEPKANAENISELLAMLDDGRIKPRISAVYPLAETADALALMAARKATGKIIIDMGRDG